MTTRKTARRAHEIDVVTPRYAGKGEPVRDHDGSQETGRFYPPYLPAPALKDAVNVAILLQTRPLLLKGEPGSGKTQLARAVASELDLPFYFWPIKSTSRARDGLYTFDTIRRLQDVQTQAQDENGHPKADNLDNYITPGPLGGAFADTSGKRPVVLIDEIDKADIDFPNDLLLELDEQRYQISETGAIRTANTPPIVFITSNDEKDLPDAFLRRCLFYFIEFPHDQLVSIVTQHFADRTPPPKSELVTTVVNHFLALRKQMEDDQKKGKKPSTSELIDWFESLLEGGPGARDTLASGGLPYPEVLLKSFDDYSAYYLPTLKPRSADGAARTAEPAMATTSGEAPASATPTPPVTASAS